MKPERHIYLLVTTLPAPTKTLKRLEGGGYRLWAIGKKSSFLLPLASCLLPSLAQAQPIVPAADGTGTIVTPDGNRFNIGGGQLSRDGANLFHSFQRFGLSQGQIANFLSNDTIRNILARVTGGEASVINGLIQVTGGSPNLFLVNPAGIIFGPNAQLNVPASFTATTASGIGFGDNWFQAFGANNYSNLLGTPSAFAFPSSNPAAIINAGNLAVAAGENITLIGGTVISIGTLSAPSGDITLAAVPGEKIVRISQQGRLLSLEIAPLGGETGISTPDARAFTPLSLPQMLTGGGNSNATGISVNSEGQVVLTGGIPVSEGSVIVAGKVDAATSDKTPTLQMGGSVEILGDRIFLSNAKIDVSGINGGGTVDIGTNAQFSNTAEIHIGSDSAIAANAGVNGNGGRINIGRWGGLTITDVNSQISAIGGSNSGSGGTIEISGGGTFAGTVDLSATNGNTGTVQLNSENIIVAPDAANSQHLTDSQELAIPQIALENLTTNADVVLNANNDITINNLANKPLNLNSSNAERSVTFIADADRNGIGSFSTVNPNDAILTNGATLSISGQNLTIGKINASGGAINLTGNEISLRGGESSVSSAGGSIFIAPRTAEQGIQIGGGVPNIPNTLHLDNSDMTALDNGFKAVTIGRFDGRGAITVNAVQVNDPITLHSPGGTVAVQGEITGKDDASVTINAQSTVLNANITTHNSDININSTVTLTNDVSLKTGESGNITLASTLNSKENESHSLALAAGSGNITFRGAVGAGENQQLGNLSIQNANNVQADSTIAADSVQQLAGTGKTTLGEVQTKAPSGVDITTNSDIKAGNITSNGGDIRLVSQTGNMAVGMLNSSARVHEIAGNINVNAAGNISAGSVISFGFDRGGDISIASANGGIAVESINASSKSGNLGNVHVKTAQYFHVANSETKVQNARLAVHSQQAKINTPQQVSDTYASMLQIEQVRSQQIATQLGVNVDTQRLNGHNIQASLATIARQTGKTPAVIYVVSRPEKLELVLLTPNGAPIFKSIAAANSDALRRQVQKLIGGVSHRPDESSANSYLSASQQLYQWLVAPLAEELEKQKIDTLAFSLDPGMRSLPLAALHDGKQFLVQKYSVGLIPSINLTDTSYQNINNFSVLAMGASQFKDPQVVPLPAVPVELSAITQDKGGRSFLNQEFTLDNLKAQQTRGQFGIIHLATHGSFDPSTPSNSYIQMWDSKLRFEQLRELGKKRLELLVLSACETAFGSQDAELGFAGLAVQSGVKSVLASLWQVDDAGTLGLMSEFYRQLSLQGVTVKAEALRQAQIAMIEGDLRVEKGELRSASRGGEAQGLPLTDGQAAVNLSHPYYWASFTMIGSLW